MNLLSNRICGEARYCLSFPCFGCDLTLPEGFDPRVLGCNLQENSVETIEAIAGWMRELPRCGRIWRL